MIYESELPEINYILSFEKHTDLTILKWPFNVLLIDKSNTLNNIIFPSSYPTAINLLSGEKLTE